MFYIAVVAVSYAGVAYIAVATINLAVGMTVVYAAAAATKTKVAGGKIMELSQNLDIYMLSSNDNREISFINDDLTNVVEDTIDVYKEIYVEDAKNIDLNRLKQTINLNLSKQEAVADNIIIIEADNENI